MDDGHNLLRDRAQRQPLADLHPRFLDQVMKGHGDGHDRRGGDGEQRARTGHEHRASPGAGSSAVTIGASTSMWQR